MFLPLAASRGVITKSLRLSVGIRLLRSLASTSCLRWALFAGANLAQYSPAGWFATNNKDIKQRSVNGSSGHATVTVNVTPLSRLLKMKLKMKMKLKVFC